MGDDALWLVEHGGPEKNKDTGSYCGINSAPNPKERGGTAFRYETRPFNPHLVFSFKVSLTSGKNVINAPLGLVEPKKKSNSTHFQLYKSLHCRYIALQT